MDTQVADALLGTLVDGRYRVRSRVARGGMATVYTATDERLERTVALKIIHPGHSGDATFVERFTDEAKTIARLTHPNVVAVYDQGTHAGLPYLVMEYVRGHTLRDVLARRRRLGPVEALAIMEQVLSAVAAAHRAGLVHRDVKPENVLVAEAPSGGGGNLVDSVVKVADFGLARAVEASAEEEPGGGHLMATVAYVAPELVTDGHADPRTDVYSAGIVLFEMLTGRVPYDGDRPVEVAWQHVDHDVPPPSRFVPDVPPVLDNLVAVATRRDPSARPTDAGSLLAEVQAARDDLGGTTQAVTARLRPVADDTMVVGTVQPGSRPAWSRLPEPRTRPQPRRRAEPAPTGATTGDRLRLMHRRVMGDPRRRRIAVAVLIVLALLLVAGGWWFGFGRYTAAPQLAGMTGAAAQEKATAAGFQVTVGPGRYDEQVAKDTVLAQDPPEGERIVKNGTITLTLSLGPERYPVPDVVGKAYDVAVSELEAAKLTVKRGAEHYDDRIPAGSVLTVEPGVGTEMKPGAEVTVTVSRGRAPVTVPRVVGQNITEARALLQRQGLTVIEEYVDGEQPQGEVISQDPADGAGVENGAQIKLKISNGPPAVPVPDVTSAQNIPCRQAEETIRAAGFAPQISGNPAAVARVQTPAPNTPHPPGSPVGIVCY